MGAGTLVPQVPLKPVLLTTIARLSPSYERRIDDPGAERRGQLSGVVVDLGPVDAVRRVERNALPARERVLQELRPDGQGGLRARQADDLVVVVADPHDRQQFRGEPDEPGI